MGGEIFVSGIHVTGTKTGWAKEKKGSRQKLGEIIFKKV